MPIRPSTSDEPRHPAGPARATGLCLDGGQGVDSAEDVDPITTRSAALMWAAGSPPRPVAARRDVANLALLTFPPTTHRSWYGRAFRLTFATFHGRISSE